MSKLKKKVKSYIENSLSHEEQIDNVRKKVDLQNNKKENFRFMKKGLKFAISACCLIIVAVFAFVLLDKEGSVSSEESAVVQMNVNPSVSFVVSNDETIISVYGENDEGKMLIIDEEFKGLKLDEAIEKILKLQVETGFLVKGKVDSDENKISFSVEANTLEIANNLEMSIKNKVEKVCEELNVQETIDLVKTAAKEELVERALAIDSSLSLEKANSMTNQELIKYISACQIEKISIPTKQIEELYNRVKAQKINIVSKEETKKVIDALDSTYQNIKDTYQSLYNGLVDAQNQLNETYNLYFVNYDSDYQVQLRNYQTKKAEVLKLQNEIAQLEDGLEKTIKQGELTVAMIALTGIEEAMNLAKSTVETIVNGVNTLINNTLESMDQFYNQLPSEIKTQINDSLVNIEDKINNAKDNLFTEFEENYKDDIKAAYNQAKAYKENLVNNLK